MKDANTGPRPDDEKLFVFSVLVNWLGKLRGLFKLLTTVLLDVSPAVPRSLSDALGQRATQRALWWGMGLTFVFSFVVVAIWTVHNGTWAGTDPQRLYFSRDLTNLTSYILLCPLYVGFAAQLIVLVIQGWPAISNPPLTTGVTRIPIPSASLGLLSLIVLSLATGFTINYVQECLNPRIYPKVSWYVSTVTADGTRILGGLGLYYALLNFVLLLFCLLALLAFCSLCFLCLRYGKLISQQPVVSTITFDSIQASLTTFTDAYLIVKLLAATLMVNAYVWKWWTAPKSSINFVVMGLVLAFFGVVLVSIPRYYIELEWFKFRVRRAIALGHEASLSKDDLRPFNVRLIVHFVDGLIISGFILSFFFEY